MPTLLGWFMSALAVVAERHDLMRTWGIFKSTFSVQNGRVLGGAWVMALQNHSNMDLEDHLHSGSSSFHIT